MRRQDAPQYIAPVHVQLVQKAEAQAPGDDPASPQPAEDLSKPSIARSIPYSKKGWFKSYTVNTSFLSACEAGDVGEIRAALSAGADVNASGVTGLPALSRAAEKGHEQAVKVLLECGAIVNTKIRI